MPYDLETARQSGVQDKEISNYLSQKVSDYDLAGARAAKVPEKEIAEHLAGRYNEQGYGGGLGRAAGLSVRPYARTALTLGGLGTAVGDPLTGGRTSQSVDAILRTLGFPEPETPTERVAASTAEAMGGAALTGGASAVARPVSRLGQYLREVLARDLGKQAGASGAGAAAGGTVLEAEGSPEAQLTAAVAANVAAMRAPQAMRSAVASRVAPIYADFERAGTTPSLGQASGSRTIQTAEEIAANLPGGRRVIERFRAGQQAGMGQHAREIDEAVFRMGKAPPKMQNAAGDVFSADQFLSRWSTLDTQARQNFVAKLAVAKGQGNSEMARQEYNRMWKDLDSLAHTAETLRKQSQEMGFVRQFGRWTPGGLVIFSVLTKPMGAALAFGGALTGGRAFTSPGFVRWLSDSSKIVTDKELPRAMLQLRSVIANERDPETRAAIVEYAKAVSNELSNVGEEDGRVQ